MTENCFRANDQFGLELNADNPDAVALWNSTVLAFLSHSSRTPELLESTIGKSKVFPMAQIAKGYFCMLLGQRKLKAAAADAFVEAHSHFQHAETIERERIYAEGLAFLINGYPSISIAKLKEVLKKHPEDGFAVKILHSMQFILGDSAGMRKSLERIMSAYGDDNPAKGYVYGCYAFALEETGEYGFAEKTGRRALEISKDDAWGLHAVAHVHDMTGRNSDGIQWLESRSDSWKHCNNFRFHCWWHLALLHLDRREYDKVLSLYDSEVRIDRTDDYRDIANAVSLLGRLEFEGVDVGDRWEELAALSENHINDKSLVFADLHYAISLLAAGRTDSFGKLKSNLVELAGSRKGDMSAVARDAGIPVISGLGSYWEGDYCAAFEELNKAGPKLQRIGGSHAQRDLFERMTIEAAIKSNNEQAAIDLLNGRLRKRGGLDGYGRRRLESLGNPVGDPKAEYGLKLSVSGV